SQGGQEVGEGLFFGPSRGVLFGVGHGIRAGLALFGGWRNGFGGRSACGSDRPDETEHARSLVEPARKRRTRCASSLVVLGGLPVAALVRAGPRWSALTMRGWTQGGQSPSAGAD